MLRGNEARRAQGLNPCALEPLCRNHWACLPSSRCSTAREAVAVRSPRPATREEPTLCSQTARTQRREPMCRIEGAVPLSELFLKQFKEEKEEFGFWMDSVCPASFQSIGVHRWSPRRLSPFFWAPLCCCRDVRDSSGIPVLSVGTVRGGASS